MHFGIVTLQAWLHLLFSLLSTSMLMCAHSTAHLIIYARNLAHASLETTVQRATRAETKPNLTHHPTSLLPPSAPDRKHTASDSLPGHKSRSFTPSWYQSQLNVLSALSSGFKQHFRHLYFIKVRSSSNTNWGSAHLYSLSLPLSLWIRIDTRMVSL